FFSSRRRHTRCLSDWSSDVCSSDLNTMERAVILADGVSIRADALQMPTTKPDDARLPAGMLPEKFDWDGTLEQVTSRAAAHVERSEERRVGKEGRAGGGGEQYREEI